MFLFRFKIKFKVSKKNHLIEFCLNLKQRIMKNIYYSTAKSALLILISLLLSSAINGQNPNDGYNLIKNGNFELVFNGLSSWDLWKNTNAGFNATHHLASGNKHSGNRSAKIKITSIGNTSNPYKVHLYNKGGISVKSGHSYQGSVWIKASNANATAKITFRKNSPPYTLYEEKLISLNTGWTMYSVTWDGNNLTTNNVRFSVEMGSHTGKVFVDDAIITNCSRPTNYLTMQSSIIGNGRIEMQTTNGRTECLKLGNNSFQQGEQVTLKAIPEPGYSFTKWGGANTSNSSSCNITVNSNTHINAYFTKTSNVDVDIHYRNRVDWSNAGYEGSIPHITSNVIDMTQAPYNCSGNGSTNNYNKVKTALDDADNRKGWTVLFFPPGTYKIKGSDPLNIPDSTIIRGDCPSSTTLKLMFKGGNNHDNGGCFQAKGSDDGNLTDVLSGLHLNSKQITIADANAYKAGDFIEIRQDNIPDLMYHAPGGLSGQTDSEVAAKGNLPWATRAVGEIARIVAKNGNTLYLDRGLHHTYNRHRNPEITKIIMASNIGIENIKLYNYIKSSDASQINKNNRYWNYWNIKMSYCYNSWIRNVESRECVKGHVALYSSYHCEVSESYFNGAYHFGSGGFGSGVNMKYRTTLNLVENNIFSKLRHAMKISLGVNGNAFGFNYSRKSEDNNIDKCDISLHGFYPFMNLFESNKVKFIYSSDWNGSSGPGNTFFRNNTNGKVGVAPYLMALAPVSAFYSRAGIIVKNYSHYQNIIGNEVTNWTTFAGLNYKINVTSNCKGTNQHSNYYKHLNSYKIDYDKRHTLTNSLYKTNTNFNFPYPVANIGPYLAYKAHNIKAYDRFKGSGANAPCLNPCGPASNDTTLITTCGNSAQIQLPTFDAKHVLHGVTVKDYSGSPGNYEAGKPEIYIEIYKNNSQNYLFQSNRALSESGNPPKYISCPNIVLDTNATYRVEIWDYDKYSSDELMGSVTFQGNTSILNHNNGGNKIRLNKTIYNTMYNWSNGATTSSTTITQSGLVSAIVTTPEGCESIYNYNVVFNTSPQVTSQPQNKINCLGTTTPPMSINATGGFNLDYQWYSNSQNSYTGGVPIPNANSSSYNPPTNIAGIFYYWCVVTDVTNSNCGDDTSIIANQMVFEAPSIVQQGVAYQVLCQYGNPTPLNVIATSSLYNLQYRWYQTTDTLNTTNGVFIPGPNSISFIPPSDSIGIFYYYCLISSSFSVSGCFATTSDVFTVEVIDQPTIASQGPSYQTVCQNTPATPLNITVTGPSSILSYTWVSSTNPSGPTPTANLIPGANGSSYSPPTNTSGTFYYYSNISVNAYGCSPLSSNFYTVDVKDSPMIDGERSNYANWRQTLCLGAPAGILTAHGNSGNFSHQWYHNTSNSYIGATPITGASLDNYIPNNYPVGDHYFFCVKDDLSTNACPPCTTQIYGLTVINSATASFNYNIFGSNVYFQNISPYATSCHWDFGDGTSSTNYSPTHYYVDGQYTATLIVNTPCGPDTMSKTFTVNTQIHMVKGGKKGGEKNNTEQSGKGKIKVYPNPVVNQKHFNISVSSTDLGNIKIFDSMANCVKTQTLTSNPSSIDISQLSKGIYVIVWQNNSTSISQQLIIQ